MTARDRAMTPQQYVQDKAAHSGSSFYYAFMFLPTRRRAAITAFYAYCREVDDVVDEVYDPSVAAAKLAWWQKEVAESFARSAEERQLDHLGFILESIDRVRELEQDFIRQGVTIVHSFKIHRDGSASFYCADPDGIVIQMLYEPTLSRQDLR